MSTNFMSEPGIIKNKEHIKQLCNFLNMKWGSISPTDIDFFIDFNNKLFIFGELKHNSSPVPDGQRLALERLCDASESAGISSYVIVASHNQSDDIIVSEAIVTKYRVKGKWIEPMKRLTVMQAISKIREIPVTSDCQVCGVYPAVLFFEKKHICDTCYVAGKAWR